MSRRPAVPIALALAVAFLAPDTSEIITGQTIRADAGLVFA